MLTCRPPAAPAPPPTGNFKTLQQAIQEYGSDAMRIALADAGAPPLPCAALKCKVSCCCLRVRMRSPLVGWLTLRQPTPHPAGDTMDDANFEHTTANGAVLRLTKELAWIGAWAAAPVLAGSLPVGGWRGPQPAVCAASRPAALAHRPRAEETLAAADTLRDEAPTSFVDRVFDNEINIAVSWLVLGLLGMPLAVSLALPGAPGASWASWAWDFMFIPNLLPHLHSALPPSFPPPP